MTADVVPRHSVRATYRRLSAPRDSSPVRRRNYEVVQLESISMGIMGAASTFLPVFLVRLGGGALATGILTTLPAIGGLLFAVPLGRVMQRRGHVVRWYSVSRFVATWAYALTALIAMFAAPDLVVPLCLVAWALVMVPQTVGQVTFPIVMDGAAGPQGRYDLLGRRWALMGMGTAISVALAGIVLDVLGMPTGYELVMVSGTIAGIGCFYWSRQIRIDADAPPPPPSANTAGLPAGMHLRAQRPFISFVTRKAVFVAGVRLVAPLMPLYYVRTLGASDAWIGIIAMVQSLALVAGYAFWRGSARRLDPRWVLLLTLGVSGAIPALLAFTSSLEVVAVLSAVGAFFAAGSDLALFDELMLRIPRDQAVTFAGVDYALTNLAGIIAPLMAAVLVGLLDIQLALVAGALVSLVGLVMFVRAARAAPPTAMPAEPRLGSAA